MYATQTAKCSASLIAHLGIDECHNDRMRRVPVSSVNSNAILLVEGP